MLRRNVIPTQATMWVNLEDIVLDEVSKHDRTSIV